MAIKNIIASGIGFKPGSVMFIVTRGFNIGITVPVPSVDTGSWTEEISLSGNWNEEIGNVDNWAEETGPPATWTED